MKKKIIVEVIVSLFVMLWVYTAVSKLLDHETFRFQLGRSPYLENMTGLVAWTLPIGELAVAALLIIKSTRTIGLYASFFLMLLFTGYIYSILHYSYYVPCSCGGVLSTMSWNQHLLFNIVFVLLALTGILLNNSEENKGQNKIGGICIADGVQTLNYKKRASS